MTEDEAKTKWCPFRDNRPHWYPSDTPLCVASECMAWRVSQPAKPETHTMSEVKARGHCGLAGKP